MNTRLHGGLPLDAHRARSIAQPLSLATVTEELVLPLDQHLGVPAKSLVREGQPVRRGEPIGAPEGNPSAWLHSPVSGRVRAIEVRRVPYGADTKALCIVITNDFAETGFANEPQPAFESASPAALREHIGRGGIVGLGGAVFPTEIKLASAHEPELLLLNGAECEPYISCDEVLMRERATDIVAGARILLHALTAKRCVIAIEDDSIEAGASLRTAIAAARDERLQLLTVPPIYPAGGERQLIAALFEHEVPSGGLPASVGVICQNVGTAAAVARWVRDGEPLVSRIVTVTGGGVREPRNLEARLGVPLASLIADCGGYTEHVQRLIMGGSMMGIALPSDALPLIKATNCVLAAAASDLKAPGPALPCIRCGDCADACPARLLPQQLHWHIRSGNDGALPALGLADCIECGCCDYVCPSQIPLVESFRVAKLALRETLAARDRADTALARFTAREQRLAQSEATRQAQLAAKRQALKQNKD